MRVSECQEGKKLKIWSPAAVKEKIVSRRAEQVDKQPQYQISSIIGALLMLTRTIFFLSCQYLAKFHIVIYTILNALTSKEPITGGKFRADKIEVS